MGQTEGFCPFFYFLRQPSRGNILHADTGNKRHGNATIDINSREAQFVTVMVTNGYHNRHHYGGVRRFRDPAELVITANISAGLTSAKIELKKEEKGLQTVFMHEVRVLNLALRPI